MRRHGGLVVGLAVATLGFVLALTVASDGHRIATAVYVLVVAGLLLATLTRAVHRALEPAPRSLFDPPPASERPPVPLQFTDIQRRLTEARDDMLSFEARLRPLLFQAAAGRASRRGLDVERHPDVLRTLVGDEAWELLRPDLRGERLAGRHERGVSDEKLRMLIETVERL